MLRKDFVLRMKDIKEHVRLIDRSFVPRTNYADNSHMIDLVNERGQLISHLPQYVHKEFTKL